jgi:hypothetical protein
LPLKAVRDLDDRQREIRRLAYLMMMTTDKMGGKSREHWVWFAGIVVPAGAAGCDHPDAVTGEAKHSPDRVQAAWRVSRR